MSKEGASHRTPTPAHLHGPSCPFFKPLLIPPPWRPPTSHFFLSPLFLYQAFFFLCLLPVHYPTLWISTAAVTVPVRFLAATRLPKIRINSRIRPCAPQLPLCSAEDQTQQPRLDCTAVTVRHSRPRGQTRRGRLHRGPCPISVLSRFCLRTPVPPQLLQGSLQPQPVKSHRETSTRWLHRTSHRTF